MKTTVVLAEKPSVAKEIAESLGAKQKADGYYECENGYRVTWAYGHLVALAHPEAYGEGFKEWKMESLPIMPEKWIMEVTEGTGKTQFYKIKSLFAHADEIICATDAGREGELIFRYIYEMSGATAPVKRLWLSSFTEQAIKEGFKNLKPSSDYDSLYFAARARGQADWLVGLNATRALSIAGHSQGSALSLGRVQSPVMNLVVKRTIENRQFVPEPFWDIVLGMEKEGLAFSAKSASSFQKEEEAAALLKAIQAHDKVECQSVQGKKKAEAPPQLYDLTTLQREANQKFGYSAQETLDTAQSLYEKYKLTTYPRTDSRYLSEDLESHVLHCFQTLRPGQGLDSAYSELAGKELRKTIFDNAKVSDHHAIIPTGTQPPADLPGKEKAVYFLVCLRFAESFSEDCIKETTSAVFGFDGIAMKFHATGTVILWQGWRGVKENTLARASEAEEKEEGENNEGGRLPEIKEKELFGFSPQIKKGMTKPRPLYTESSLLADMERYGLGTPATRAEVIEKLLHVGYMQREKKNLLSTQVAVQLCSLLRGNPILSVEMTAKWEEKLEQVRQKVLAETEFSKEIRQYAREVTGYFKEHEQEFKVLGEQKLEQPCPKCKAEGLVSTGNRVACEKEACGFVLYKKFLEVRLGEQDIENILQGKSSSVKAFTSKSTGKPFKARLFLNADFRLEMKFEQAKAKKGGKPVKKKSTKK